MTLTENTYILQTLAPSLEAFTSNTRGESVWESVDTLLTIVFRAHKSYIFASSSSVYLINKQTGTRYRSISLEDNFYGMSMAVTSGSVLYAGFPRNGSYGSFIWQIYLLWFKSMDKYP